MVSPIKEKLPSLRFQKYNKLWQKISIEDICSVVTSGSRDWAQYYSDCGNKFIRMTNLPKEGVNLLLNKMKYVKLPSASSEGKRTSLKHGDILISITAELGKIGLVPKDLGIAYINQHTALIRPDNKKYDSRFVAQVLASPSARKDINKLNDSGAKAGLNLSSIKSFKRYLPQYEEQQNIADFLSAVDTKISLLKEKHALIEQYKKGVMQKLFSQEIRFKDESSNDFSDWINGTLGDLSDKISNKNKDELVTNVLTNSAKLGIVSQTDYFKKDIANQSNLGGYSIVEKDDFIYNPRISELAPVGPIKRNHIGQGVMSPLYTVFRFKNDDVLDYLELYFGTTQWHRYMNSIANFGARHDRMNITMGDFFNLPIPIPSQGEMLKIVGFVESLNKKVDLVAQQLKQTQNFKKGLLQQMFV
jgi:type I restriction enzyme S subunit